MLYSLKKGMPTLKPDSLSLSAAQRLALLAAGLRSCPETLTVPRRPVHAVLGALRFFLNH